MRGPDHRFSADPEELSLLVEKINILKKQMGNGSIAPSAEENEMAAIARRSIVASIDIAEGSTVSDEMLAFKRPGGGMMPYDLEKIVGKRARVYIKKDTQLSEDMIENAN